MNVVRIMRDKESPKFSDSNLPQYHLFTYYVAALGFNQDLCIKDMVSGSVCNGN
jgi:hypothetical protein